MVGDVQARRNGYLLRSSSAMVALCGSLALAGCQSAPIDVDAETVAAKMKEKMTLPARVDDDTRLDDVRALSRKELGYFLTLTTMTKARFDANPSLGAQLEGMLRGGACENASYVKFFKAGISLGMVYRTSDNVEVRRVVIAPRDCGL